MTRHQARQTITRHGGPPPAWPWFVAAAVVAVLVFAILGGELP